jgi:YesN/AraC family two-component response regulator
MTEVSLPKDYQQVIHTHTLKHKFHIFAFYFSELLKYSKKTYITRVFYKESVRIASWLFLGNRNT